MEDMERDPPNRLGEILTAIREELGVWDGTKFEDLPACVRDRLLIPGQASMRIPAPGGGVQIVSADSAAGAAYAGRSESAGSLNREMDAYAVANGLGHWRCMSASSNAWWRRLDDGLEVEFGQGEGILWDVLRGADKSVPIQDAKAARPDPGLIEWAKTADIRNVRAACVRLLEAARGGAEHDRCDLCGRPWTTVDRDALVALHDDIGRMLLSGDERKALFRRNDDIGRARVDADSVLINLIHRLGDALGLKD